MYSAMLSAYCHGVWACNVCDEDLRVREIDLVKAASRTMRFGPGTSERYRRVEASFVAEGRSTGLTQL